MAKKIKKKVPSKIKISEEAKLFAFLAVFLGIIGFIIAAIVKKDDKYVMHYAKQSLVIFIAMIASGIIMMVPIIGWFMGVILYIMSIALWFIGWIYALSGEIKEVPIIGKYGRKINL